MSFVFPEFVFNKDLLLYLGITLMIFGLIKIVYHGIRIKQAKTETNQQSIKNQKIATYHNLLEYLNKTIEDIPATKVKLDSWDSTPFKKHTTKEEPKFKE